MQISKDGLLISESGGHRLTFAEKRHRYSLDDKHIGSVTGSIGYGYPEHKMLIGWKIGQGAEYVINEFKKSLKKTKKAPGADEIKDIIKSSKSAFLVKSRKAADIGTIVHDYAYHYEKQLPFDMDKIQQHKDREKIENSIGQFIGWRGENEDEILELEHIVASPRYWFAGKFDRLARRKGKVVLDDYKTSSGIFVDMFIKEAAYSIAIYEWLGIKVDALEIVRFGKDGSFEVESIEGDHDIQQFQMQALRCIDTTAFRREYEEAK